MKLDSKLSALAVEKRKATKEMCEAIEDRLLPHIAETTWPSWLYPEIAKHRVNGL